MNNIKDLKYSEILKYNTELGSNFKTNSYDITVLSNITINQIKEILEYTLREKNINANVKIGDYDIYLMDYDVPMGAATRTAGFTITKDPLLKYVYTGNIPGDEGENTFCHECGELLINRFGFQITQNKIKGNCCPKCGVVIPGVWGN